MFCLIVENCTPQIETQTYYNLFETQVLNVVLHNEIRHQHQLFRSYKLLGDNNHQNYGKGFDNECFTCGLKCLKKWKIYKFVHFTKQFI